MHHCSAGQLSIVSNILSIAWLSVFFWNGYPTPLAIGADSIGQVGKVFQWVQFGSGYIGTHCDRFASILGGLLFCSSCVLKWRCCWQRIDALSLTSPHYTVVLSYALLSSVYTKIFCQWYMQNPSPVQSCFCLPFRCHLHYYAHLTHHNPACNILYWHISQQIITITRTTDRLHY